MSVPLKSKRKKNEIAISISDSKIYTIQHVNSALENYRNSIVRFRMRPRSIETFQDSDEQVVPTESEEVTRPETYNQIALEQDLKMADLLYKSFAKFLIENRTLILESQYSNALSNIIPQIFLRLPKCLPALNTEQRYSMEFEEIKKLGEGGFGSVYKARHKIDGRYYAIKKIPIFDFSKDVDDILKEVKTLARLNDPHIVRYHSAWIEKNLSPFYSDMASNGRSPEQYTDDDTDSDSSQEMNDQKGTLYIQMELCKGSLKEWLVERNKEKKSSKEIVNDIKNRVIIQGMLKGVASVHAERIIHRDLKPDNIFLKEETDTAAKIGDFGLATSRNEIEYISTENSRTWHTQGVGTCMYSSPEQQNGTDYDTKSDIYSLGLIIYEMYHPCETIMEQVKSFQELKTERKIHEFVCQNFPQKTEMILAMTHKVPAERPTAKELLAQVQPPSSKEIIRSQIEEIAKLREEAKLNKKVIKSQNEEIAQLKKVFKNLELQLENKDS